MLNITYLRALVRSLASAIFLARDLITTPAEDMGPQHMVAEARSLVEGYASASIRVIQGDDLLGKVR